MKRHLWRQVISTPGHKRERCQVCKATRDAYNMYTRDAGGYGPAFLNGQRQPYCPGQPANVDTLRSEEVNHARP